jgi:ubiquinone/menaquinone biosynthesis C-methylase UbiE
MENVTLRETVLDANITFHTSLSKTYNEQPHYRPENRNRLTKRIKELAGICGNNTCIDLGCGTGFMIDLALPFFSRIYGIDITPAMMSQVDRSSGKVQLIEANTESVPLKECIANMITSNSFLHHLWDIKPTIHEAYRLLRSGGVFFSEEDPNILFWQGFKNLGGDILSDTSSDYITGEMASVMETHNSLGEKMDMDPDTIKLAEYQKMVKGGMDASKIKTTFHEAGFTDVTVEYYWFLGQGKVTQKSAVEAKQIESYLKAIMPLSRGLFKYLRVIAWK